MKKNNFSSLRVGRGIVLLLLFGWLLYGAGREFYDIAWGSGTWVGEFSPKWLLAFLAFVLLAVAVWGLAALRFFSPRRLKQWVQKVITVREGLELSRWPLMAILLLSPVLLLQYTPWGVVISGFYLRLLLWILVAGLVAILATRGKKSLVSWPALLSALLVSSALLVAAAAFTNVTDYPFSLGWSEGNRLWDYSLLFGRDRYVYPSGQPLEPFLDIGRELLGGLPFIIPGLNILGARLWLALLGVIPYLLLGWIAFGLPRKQTGLGVMGAFWAFIFVKQGPIHSPLLLCAILVALAWRRPLWLALPLIAFAGYFAQVSRFTWMFAPAMWAGMLEFSAAQLEQGKVNRRGWLRTLLVALAGLVGGVLLPAVLGQLYLPAGEVSSSGVPFTDQPLLWYRLLPNATYGNGILLGLLLAVGPLVALLFYLAATRRWKLNPLQRLAVVAPLMAFLAVGLVVSTKIGGGGDLHNMDMFILGLVFAAAIAWQSGGSRWVAKVSEAPRWTQAVLVLLLTIPAVQPLMSLRPLEFADSEDWLVILTDVEAARFLDSLPDQQYVRQALATINYEVNLAKAQGEVLFMDQRQLLTFGYIQDVPLVAEYEKKGLINEALSGSVDYFIPFYEDLAAGRFSLIVTQPLFTPIKDEDYVFGEENNAWVDWVSIPVLCYYERAERLRPVRVELLVPRQDPQDCSALLPTE